MKRKFEHNRKENLLIQCEAIIQEGLNHMNKVDRALSIINDLQLYDRKYKNFDSYCQTNWRIQNRYTYLFLKQNKD